ncbi:hypothetical protein LTR94_028741, partial [Friedmanniomyces endolithicus]
VGDRSIGEAGILGVRQRGGGRHQCRGRCRLPPWAVEHLHLFVSERFGERRYPYRLRQRSSRFGHGTGSQPVHQRTRARRPHVPGRAGDGGERASGLSGRADVGGAVLERVAVLLDIAVHDVDAGRAPISRH